jgi:hypothetical protein
VDVSLNDLLAIVGRLDDAPGFDTPRERFRRFLFERASDADTLRRLIEQGQHSLGEQHRRAVQDALVMVGRVLGFETTFGSYQRGAGAPGFDGRWRSRRQLDITLDVRDDRTPISNLPALSDALATRPSGPHHDTDIVRLALCIVTPLHGDRALLDEALFGHHLPGDVRVVSLRSLLWLADRAQAGYLSHDDIVRLFVSAGHLELVLDLMKRVTADLRVAAGPGVAPEVEAAPEVERPAAAGYWLMTIEPDEATSPEQVVESVVGGRHLLGVPVGAVAPGAGPRPGDWVCFSLPGSGVAGHAQIASPAETPPRIRHADRFSAVFDLRNVEVYDAPHAYADWPRDAGRRGTREAATPIVALSPEEFGRLTAGAGEGGVERRRPAS